MALLFDTIAAVSTPPGKGGVAVIRMSGEQADRIGESLFSPKGNLTYRELKPRVQYYGYIVRCGEVIDDVLLVRYPAPKSYTGEDTVEISCHGGTLITRTVLEALLTEGARAAEPGEFTRRAFINGKLTLTETEAIGSLLDAHGSWQIKLSSEPSRRRLNERISAIRERLVRAMSSMYARIDYPDEDLGDYGDGELLSELAAVKDMLLSLKNTYRTGRAISEGITAAIVGKPNVGKSSFYNMLVGEDAAIVTSLAGTTRDVLEKSVSVGKVMLRLCDTAGIRHGENLDAVEQIGMNKSRKMMEKCELLFTIFDASRPFDDEDEAIIDSICKLNSTKIAVINKCDRECVFDKERLGSGFDRVLTLSTLNEAEAISAVTEALEELFTDGKIALGKEAVISSARQHAALSRSLDFLCAACDALELGISQDAVSSDVERSLGALGELDGRAVSEEIVQDIFSRFCVGK
ncbi:MAG: tRNA uridine-5-carboxymethylaminomethyl(34) synthesis GTPase MnmE [Clostridia bacterium]|nr:tRNA uridine-5-carboxymethylaminomethyl(34) synthesis GTPase MnmE [Clostridia bacterium]